MLDAVLVQLGNPQKLRDQLARAIQDRDSFVDQINTLIRTAAHSGFDPDAFERDHNKPDAAYQRCMSEAETIENKLQELEAKRVAITAFHQYRSEHPAISYTLEAWRALVDHATIRPDDTITITFNDGTTL
ncbi:hypothetical protein [Actinomyces faecalis]|uniref:hypothetical protein n=1 Tax=Actinomyces faecalis TaxID=2722820 RepID=UPI00155769B0|nr:hypothetical protein [Actinomyces faecalis]